MANKPLILDSAGKVVESVTPQITDLLDPNGNTILHTAAAVGAANYLIIENTPAGTSPSFSAGGTDANIGFSFYPKGTAGVFLRDSNGARVFTVNPGVASATNNITCTNAAAGNDPKLNAEGGDTNVSLNLTTQGTGVVKANGLPVMAPSMCRLDSAYTLTSTTSVQKLFNSSTNGALTLPVGTYRFQCLLSLSSMSATSGNGAFSLAGTATLGTILMFAIGRDGSVNTVATLDGTMNNTAAFPNPMHTAQTAAGLQTLITGTFEVTVAGTIIPSFALNTAAAAVVAAGSYFECWPVGSTTVATIGAWS